MKTVALIFGLLVAVATVSIGFADSDHKLSKTLVESGKILSLQEIISLVSKEESERVLEAELEDENGRYIYEIELLDGDGKVWEYEVDATTGEILSKERED